MSDYVEKIPEEAVEYGCDYRTIIETCDNIIAEQMIGKDIRVNNEFYVCPVFNEAIADCKKIKTFDIPKMWGIGTPEDLDVFLNNYKGEV